MDNHDSKLDMVLNLIEHPELYSSKQIDEILSDDETRNLYNLLCKTSSAICGDTAEDLDLDSEWRKISNSGARHGWRRFIPGNRAATTTFLISSLTAAAVGLTVTLAVMERKPEPAYIEMERRMVPITLALSADNDVLDAEKNKPTPEKIIFEDARLHEIMEAVESRYGVTVHFENKEVAELHLYYTLDFTLSIDEIIEQLNNFEQINIHRQGDALTIK